MKPKIGFRRAIVTTGHGPLMQPAPYKCNKSWQGPAEDLNRGAQALQEALMCVARPVFVIKTETGVATTHKGAISWGERYAEFGEGLPLIGFVPPLHPADLGDASFKRDLNIRYPYVVGAMANGITSVEMVQAAGQAGMIGFFGAGGLSLQQIEQALDRLAAFPNVFPYGFNLIHSPNDPQLEAAVVDLYLSHGVRIVSASAFLGLTLPLIHYRVKGIHQTPDGRIVCPNHVIAKVSRIEVAQKFFSPPPQKLLDQLVAQGKITKEESRLAARIPVAQDITAEADSGGHTDNRPALTMLPTFMALRNRAVETFDFDMPLRVGLAGGIATPAAVAGAFAMGASYVLTGSINQSCIEADTSDAVRTMLAKAQQADVTMAPAADMFEMGVRVQVLKRGTMFAMRAGKLYEIYRAYDDYHQVPGHLQTTIERDLLRAPFEEAWQQTRQYFKTRDQSQIKRAEQDPRHKMALVFRSYLGRSSLWAKRGDPDRQMDYQIWCGPAMGAFNAWVQGSFLESIKERRTATVAMNLLYGAAGLTRCHWLQSQGVDLPAIAFRPLPLEMIEQRLQA